ncbi:hypothetical protein [Ruminococcus sp.]|uniref:hypothetical protein n=1 Tax=Ruminococcus sp. TaxID=41978 RepID=UPI001B73C042|nr:hypothetical protein [Ruminococcus sp.]MBP1591516.1 hypothetical protein [Oscillospiraceae bacterium]MBP5432880.1 hypothetical protein [Ruminococcus sp.]
MENETEKFLIFTTDSACFECVPEGECDSASNAFLECIRLQKKNKYANYLIKCPDGVIRTAGEVVEEYINPPKKMHEEIPGDTVIWRFDGVRSATVYLGWLSDLTPADVKWRQDDESYETAELCDCEADYITLDELAEQFPKKQITVIIDDPLNGEIWNYGNAGKMWLRIGITGGYA